MKNIHVLPVNKPSSLYFSGNNSELLFLKGHIFYRAFGISPQNIYITSDEEIKEGVNQWYLDKVLNKPRNSSGSQYGENQNVIILTTDQDLIKDGVQAIDDEFLEWFIKNPSCEEVEIINTWDYDNKGWVDRSGYKIQITKEEPKQDLPIVNGSYGCTIQTKKQEPKQETLEELKKWREEALIAHEINQKVIKKLMDEKKLMCSDEKIDKILQKLEEIKIMINIR